MRVAHFISTSGLYGAERWILGLLNHTKVDSILVCTSYDNPALINEAKKKGIKTKVLSVKGNLAVFDSAEKLKRLLKQEKIDILHTHGYKSDIIGYFAAKKTNIKIISTPHGWSFDAGLKLRIYEALDRFFLKFFDLVVPLSNGLGKSLKHVKGIKVIENFVDLSSIPKPKKGNPKLITFIGQLIERKRVQDLIIALKLLKNKEIKLQLIGDGPKKRELIALVKRLRLQNQVKFLGFRKDRLDLLNKSGLLILPSLLEGIPRVMMEAMAMKKLVIGTAIEGIKDLITHKVTGLLVPTKNPNALARAITYAFTDKTNQRRISENGRKLINKRFSAKIAAQKFDELYKVIV